MKIYINLSGFIFLMLLLGCASSKNIAGSTGGNGYDASSAITIASLPSYLRTIPRLAVRGSGQNIQVYNSSASSFQNDTRVLFVVNGIQFGRDFSRVASVFTNKNQIVSVEFLKMSRATLRYGEEGRNGVILIESIEN